MRRADDLGDTPPAPAEESEPRHERPTGTDRTTRLTLRDLAFAFAAWSFGALVFFRSAFGSGFDKIMGDVGDARFLVFVSEHWVHVLRGYESWTSPSFYFPIKGVLGYSDTLILNELFYAPLRAAGCDEFLAFQWTIVLMSLSGFLALFALLRRTMGLSVTVCVALASAVVFANAMYVKASHAQLYSLYWLPVVMLMMHHALMDVRRLVKIAWGLASGVTVGLLFVSTYYIAWFAVVSVAIFSGVLLALRVSAVGLRSCAASLGRQIGVAGGFLLGFVLAMIPFAIVYLPALRASGGRSYSEAMLYAARPADIVNLGGANYLWGSLMRTTLSDGRLANGEVSLAVTPILLISALTLGAVLIRRRRSGHSVVGDVGIAAAVTLGALVLLPVKFGWGSAWRVLWTLVPGAVGIRAVDRIVLLGGLFAVVVIGASLSLLSKVMFVSPWPRRFSRVVASALLFVVVVEQLNMSERSFIDRSDELSALRTSPAPPPLCESFFIIDSSPTPVPFYQSSIDAMLISQHFRLPTVNGYSGQFPVGYSLIDPGAPGYLDQVHLWADSHNLRDGLCSYDRATRTWAVPGA